MAKTKLQTVAKIGKLEIKKRVELAETKPSTKKVVKKGAAVAVGVKGNTGYWGSADTGEYLSKLQGASGRSIYDQMRRSDGQVKAVLNAVTLPLRQATYFVEPPTDDAKDIEIAEIVKRDLLENMTMTWDDTVRHICLMFPFGFSVLEKLYEYREDRITWRKFDPRLPQSIMGWQYDKAKRSLIGPTQMDTDGSEILLPIEKLLVFTIDKEGDNWEGISLLRSVYKAWYIKDQLEKINAITHERHGAGVPVLTVPAGIKQDSDEWNAAVTILEDLQANETNHLVLPEGYVFTIEGLAGQGTDILPSIKHYDEDIAKSALAQFINLGTTETGSRALGDSFIDLFLIAIQAFADQICEVINRFAIREMVDFNWSVDEYPQLRVRRIQKLDPTVLAILKNAGLITADDDLENVIRQEFNLPELPEDLEREDESEDEPEPPVPPEKDPDPDETEDVEQPDEDDKKMSDRRRELYDWELTVDFDAIEYRLNTDTFNLEDNLLKIRETQIEHIITELVGGRKIQNITVPGKKDMYALLIQAFKVSAGKGRAEVNDELARQGYGRQFADPVSLEEVMQIVAEEFGIAVDGAADKLKAIIAQIYLDARKMGLTGAELRSEIQTAAGTKVSTATWSAMATKAVNEGNGAGRRVAAEAVQNEIDECYYSALLDSNCCEVCRPKDGVRHEFNDPDYVTPNPQCLGGGRCRCMTIYIMKAERE